MAWQVYDFMHPGYEHRGHTGLMGPLPRRRWVPHPSDPKPRKIRSRTAPQQFFWSASERQDRKAVEYATWLASRDGIELPDATRICHAEYITVAGKRERRVRSVEWRRKDLPSVVVGIPHWDHVPNCIEEHDAVDVAA